MGEASGRGFASGFGRGWIPAERPIGLPGDEDGPPALPSLDHPDLADRSAAARRDGWTPARKVRFLDRLATGGTVRAACASVGISAQAAYVLRRRDTTFAHAWDAALALARDHGGIL